MMSQVSKRGGGSKTRSDYNKASQLSEFTSRPSLDLIKGMLYPKAHEESSNSQVNTSGLVGKGSSNLAPPPITF
jgi:hypothetical protein